MNIGEPVVAVPEPSGLAVMSCPVLQTAPGPSKDLESGAPDKSIRKPKRETTNEQFKKMMRRMVNAYLRRVENGDLQTLADFVEVLDHMKLALDIAVAARRNDPAYPASWTGIAKATGLSRSAAHEKWSALGGLRRVGGQTHELGR